MRIGLFVTCFNDLLFPDVGKAVVRILEALGHDVDFPEGQTCCGQLHFNTGYREACVPLVRRFAEVFEGYDAIVTPSASCAAMVRHHHVTVAQHARDDELLVEASRVAPRVLELTEFLVERDALPAMSIPFDRTVALHPTCHSTRLLGVGDRPRRVLEAVPGVRLVDLAGSDQCCVLAKPHGQDGIRLGAEREGLGTLPSRRHSSAVEQLFRKQQVLGSNPSVGSTPLPSRGRRPVHRRVQRDPGSGGHDRWTRSIPSATATAVHGCSGDTTAISPAPIPIVSAPTRTSSRPSST